MAVAECVAITLAASTFSVVAVAFAVPRIRMDRQQGSRAAVFECGRHVDERDALLDAPQK